MEWNEEEQDWYLSIVDVIDILTEQATHDGARKYWSVMKTRLKKEGNELTTVCSQLKMRAVDGKFYNTDVANTKGILRIIQSIPSPKAEPFKMGFAQVEAERLDELADPEITFDRAIQKAVNINIEVLRFRPFPVL